MTRLVWWMRIVGAFYVLQFVMMVFVQAPIRAQGPAGVLVQAAAGDPTARFVVDTWVTFGLEVGAIGAVLLIASRVPGQARALIWAVVGIELARGIAADVFLIARGHKLGVLVPWMIIHTVIILTGIHVLGRSRPA